MLEPAEIVRHYVHDPANVERVVPEVVEHIAVVGYDALWPAAYAGLEQLIRAALGPVALAVEHVGSTAVPGLAAKPVIDVDVTVPDPRDEAAYVPALEAAGLTLLLREPRWHEHRILRGEAPRANVHVWGPDCPEVVRHRLLRDWLREHPADRERYAAAKRAAADETNAVSGVVMDYNARKEPVVHAILDDVFRAHGLL
ncbi:GrpB family protein [Nocardioides sp. ChNu-153]|uniref:GrpB family protein n=1 Tax=unclassified Nocardioides TaxID=2615069 RepID=UPI00240637D5|nr:MULTISPECIES: GrpB family protein [unclassified Nocardioides]MDF9714761.1 GrpB family protein [Nocardioides sp. ChNu-99]MDN7120113.1 GrpB family protein [Nocardioides sp. ChNu-153]